MTLIRRNYGTNHAYYDDPGDGTEPVKIPGVTTLISAGIPKNLTNWAAGEAAGYAVEHWDTLSKLGIAKRLDTIRYAWQRTRDRAALKGTAIHALAERLAMSETVPIPDEFDGYVQACAKFLDEYDVEPVATERPIVNRSVWYAGTFDMVAQANWPGGRQCVLFDWKTGKDVYSDAALQLAAYAHAETYVDTEGVEHPMRELGIQAGAVVHLRADGYDVLPMDIGDEPFLLFRHAAYVGVRVKWDKDTGAEYDRFKGKALDPRKVRA